MHDSEKKTRLNADRAALAAMKAASSVFDFESEGEPPHGYTLIFHGQGLARDGGDNVQVEIVELHRVELRLPLSYPENPPAIRWLTPIFHPNVSSSGFVNLRAIGLPWESDLGLDVVAERLWDLARGAYRNDEMASNFNARNWFREQTAFALPVDARPVRDLAPPSNIIRYRRRGERRGMAPANDARGEVLYIDEDTPTPELPVRVVPHRDITDGNDVLYIGDE